MTLVLRYKSTIGQDELPTAQVNVSNLGITLQYSQDSNAGGNPVVAPSYIYYVGANPKYPGDTLTINNTNTFDNYSDAIRKWGDPFFTAHIVNGSNEITESYVGFVKDGEVYYLKGGDSGAAYTLNKSTLDEAFGSENCTDNTSSYSCTFGLQSFSANNNGYLRAHKAQEYCYVFSDGESYCYDAAEG